jgi:diaminopimelate decarboxylase
MHGFGYRSHELHCENVPVPAVAAEIGTPFFLYSHTTLLNHYRAYDSAFASIPHIIAYAMKANGNLAILRLFAKEGGGADIVSGGELHRALAAGVDPGKIVFAGVGKTPEEIKDALENDILMFNVESSQEIRTIDRVAGDVGRRARVALRVNPDVDPKTHPYISTGMKEHKFGIHIEQALGEYKSAASLPNIEIAGIHQHIGSQLTEVSPYVDALGRLLNLVRELRSQEIPISYLNIGGGLGITYEDEEPPEPKDLAKAIQPLIKDTPCTLIMEPGRSLVGNAGILVTKVLYVKESGGKRFVIVDAGMNDLIRPSLYGAYHEIRPVRQASRGTTVVDVVGPICESGDFLAKERELPACEPGDLLAVMSAGAYGFAMASNYNARPRPPEVLVREDRYDLIRERENYEDLVRGERYPDYLK